MPSTIIQATVRGDQVRVGDTITVGGIPHTVTDVRTIANERRHLIFTDGNSYVLASHLRIEISRMKQYQPPKRVSGNINTQHTGPRRPNPGASPQR